MILVCALKKGPKGRDYYEYLVLSEIEGPYKCIAYHLFGRTRQQFHERYFNEIDDYMKSVSHLIIYHQYLL